MNNNFHIPACPHCGGTSGVFVNERALGWVQRQWSNNFEEEVESSGLSFTKPRTIRCSDCNKIRRDVKRDGCDIALSIAQHRQAKMP